MKNKVGLLVRPEISVLYIMADYLQYYNREYKKLVTSAYGTMDDMGLSLCNVLEYEE